MSHIFISHSVKDERWVKRLDKHIKRMFSNVSTFVASGPSDIASGDEWFKSIMCNLDNAEILVAVLSPNALDRMWVGFELGYIWRKFSGGHIHYLYFPGVNLPSPINEKQGKLMTDEDGLRSFFQGLAVELNQCYAGDSAALESLARNAYVEIPRLVENREFDNWTTRLADSNWAEEAIMTQDGSKTMWTCLDDMSFQIEHTYLPAATNFSELWVKRFPDKTAYSSYVNLNISGVTVKQETFVTLDGGRYFVPIPEIDSSSRSNECTDPTYYYDRNSLKFLLGCVIAHFYPPVTNLEQFASRQDIDVVYRGN